MFDLMPFARSPDHKHEVQLASVVEGHFRKLVCSFLLRSVVSVGRRNTKLEPTLQRKQEPKSLAMVRSAGTLPWLGLTAYSQTDRASLEALSNQRTEWCCIDLLSWQRLSGDRIAFAVHDCCAIMRIDKVEDTPRLTKLNRNYFST
jgi:hypothetical protein